MNAYTAALDALNTPPVGPWNMESAIRAHAKNGVIFCRPDVFVLARPVMLDEFLDVRRILNPHYRFDRYNAWHIWLFSGNMAKAIEFLPFPLDYVCYERKERLRIYKLEELFKKLSHG